MKPWIRFEAAPDGGQAPSGRRGEIIPGSLIFKLYDTYGFPIDIISDTVRDFAFRVDEAGFQELMEKQREQSRLHWKGSGEREVPEVYRQLSALGFKTVFLGYENLEARSKVVAVVRDENSVQESAAGDEIEIVTAETPFYGETGGQVGDRGWILAPGARIMVVKYHETPRRPFCSCGQGRGRSSAGGR